MRWIYLSPHLDDAVFSAGGLIYEQAHTGIPVEIWTLMSGYPPVSDEDLSPFAQFLHNAWGASSATEATDLRREEDRRAAAILGAEVVHFDFPDCIYRRGSNGEWLYADVFLPPHPEDAGLSRQIADALQARLKEGDVLVCQLALGSHVDHVLTRQAAESLGRPLLYDIDVPYILYHAEKLPEETAGMKELVHGVTQTGLERWQAAALEYTSQIPTLREAFDTPEKVRESLRSYWAERKGIPLFRLD
jgi:LmbE family N-acetylglucosaminyl deacetylase